MQAKDIEEIRKPLLTEIKRKEEEIKRINRYKENFRGCKTVSLRDMEHGSYTVNAAKRVATRFGTSFKLLIEDGEGVYTIWSNRCVVDSLTRVEQNNLVNIDGDFISLDNQPLGVLAVTGKGTNQYGNVSVYCSFTLNSPGNAEQSLPPLTADDSTPPTGIVTISRENLLPYRDYENLIVFPIGSVQKVDAIGYITHYGTARLVVKIGDKIYQAGQDLEGKVEQLNKDCSVKIEKTRVNQTRHIKYAICSIYEKGDWTAIVDYKKTDMLSRFDGSTCIVDVRSIDVKGAKRKLLLTNNGTVYKLKKSKLEETIKPGFV